MIVWAWASFDYFHVGDFFPFSVDPANIYLHFADEADIM